jgi:hypothetical protein
VTEAGVALWGPQDEVGVPAVVDVEGRALPGQIVVGAATL